MSHEQDYDDFDPSDVMSTEERYEDDRTAEFRLDAEDHEPWYGLADGEER